MRYLSTRRILPALIGTTILSLCIHYVFNTFQWLEIYQILGRANLLLLLISGATSIVAFSLARTLRWFLLLKNLSIEINYIDLYLCNTSAMSLTIVTPLQSGEILKVELLKKAGLIQRFSGYSAFVIERIVDLLSIVSIATISLILNTSIDIQVGYKTIFFAFLVAMILFIVLGILNRTFSHKDSLKNFVEHIKRCGSNLQSLAYVILLSFASWSIVAIAWKTCLKSIDVDISLQDSMALMSVSTIVNILSFIPGAIGISEVSITEFLRQMNLSLPSSQAGALILRFYSILTITVSLIHLFLWRAFRKSIVD